MTIQSPTLATRTLGSRGLSVSVIGLGCMGMSQWYGEADDDESVRTIHRALDLGVTLFDTAEGYGPYHNEELIGRALAGRREHAVIATKFGFKLKDGHADIDSSPANIRAVVDASLGRLHTDYVDILYQHRLDPQVPIEDVVGTMGELVTEGKVRHIGLCEVSTRTIERAHAVHPLSVVQAEFSIWERNLELDVLPLLRRLGIGLVGFCPLGRGFLLGGVKRAEEYPADDFRHHDPRLQGTHYDKNLALADALRTIAQDIGVTASQLALAWVLHQGSGIVPIPGTKRRTYLQENVAAASLTLSPETLSVLESLAAHEHVAGDRYSERMMAMIDR